MASRSCSSSGKCMRKGPVTNNGFLNFMREFRKLNCGMTMLESTKEGAKCWKKLSCADKEKYRNMVCNSCLECSNRDCPDQPSFDICPKKQKRSSCPKRRKRKSSCKRKKRRSCFKPCAPKRKKRTSCRRPKPRCGKRKKCSKSGPVTNNGYLNFIRSYRRKHCGLKPKELIMKAARAWCRMKEEKKNRYRRMACRVTKSCRHKRRRVCTGK